MPSLPKQSECQVVSSAETLEARLAQWSAAVDSAHRPPKELSDDFEAWVECLVTGSVAAKLAAVEALRRFGEQAVPPLSAMLRDPSYDVRIAAIKVLGESGDERAIRPLAEALQSCFERQSAKHSLLLGIGTALGMLALLILALAATLLAQSGTALLDWGKAVADLWASRRKQTELVRAITEALTRVGERTGSPELRRVLPDLNVVAVDVIRQGRHTRASSRAAVAQIEAVTSRIRHLPLPAAAQELRPTDLPVPSQPAETTMGRLASWKE